MEKFKERFNKYEKNRKETACNSQIQQYADLIDHRVSMCSSSCLCNCCNSEIDTIYPIRSLAFYLLQNIKNATTKKTH